MFDVLLIVHVSLVAALDQDMLAEERTHRDILIPVSAWTPSSGVKIAREDRLTILVIEKESWPPEMSANSSLLTDSLRTALTIPDSQ